MKTVQKKPKENGSGDGEVMEKIRDVIARGYNVEVRKLTDGSYGVYEVRKSLK